MANVVEEIFKLKTDTTEIIKELQKLKGTYIELTEVQKNQVIELAALEKKEKELIASRNKSANPTSIIQYNKAIDDTVKKIGFLKEATDKFTNSEHKASEEANALNKAINNAFKGTTLNAAAKEVENIKKGLEGTGNEVENVEKKTISLKAQLKALKIQITEATDPQEIERLAIAAGEIQDKLDDATNAAKVFATESPFQAVGTAIGDVVTKLVQLDFKGAADSSNLLAAASKKITFKESIEGVKQLGTTFLNFGKALLTNPFFLLTTVITTIISNFDKLKNSTGIIGDAFSAIGDIITGIKEVFFQLTDAINLTNEAYTKFLDSTIAKSQELAELQKKDAERQIAVAKALGKDTEVAEVAKQRLYVRTLQVALDATIKKKKLTDDEKKDQKELVQKILDAKNEIELIEAEGYRKRKEKAKKHADEIKALFENLDKIIRALASKQLEFNLKFKLEEGSLEQVNELYKQRRKLEEEDLKKLRQDTITKLGITRAQLNDQTKLNKEQREALSKLDIIDNLTRTNRQQEFNQAQLEASVNQIRKRHELTRDIDKQELEKRAADENLTALQIAQKRTAIEENFLLKSIELKELEIAKKKELGLSSVADEKELANLKLQIEVQSAKDLDELNKLKLESDINTIDKEEKLQLTRTSNLNLLASSRTQNQIQYEKQRLAAMIESGEVEKEAIAQKQAEIEAMEKKFYKQRTMEALEFSQQIVNSAVATTRQVLDAKTKESDEQIGLQQKRIEQAKNIADRGNAEQLEMEQKRLDDLTKQKEKYVRAQQSLAAVELIANTAIAVSKAAAEGGAAAGVTIAAALIALVAGLATSRQIASQAAFYEGGLFEGEGYTGDGNPRGESKKLGRKPYIYHNEEFIFNHVKTRQYKEIFQDIHRGEVDLKEWKSKVDAFDMLLNYKPFTVNSPYQQQQITNVVRLGQVESKLDELNLSLRALKLGLNVDEDGFTTFMQKRIERKKQIQNLARL